MMICPTESIVVRGRNMAPEDRLALPPPDGRATAAQLETLLRWRRSVRRFTEQEVDRQWLDRIVAITSTAPMGIPPHEVGIVVFHGRDKVQAFAEDACWCFERLARWFNPLVLTLMRPFLGRAQHALMRDFVRPLLRLIARKRAEGIDRFTYNAPAAMLFHHTPYGDSADCHIAATYAMLSAESLGLGSCLLGTAVALTHDKQFKRKHGIPGKNKVVLALVLGHPAVEFRRGITRRLASVRFV
jgi:nitroreductase